MASKLRHDPGRRRFLRMGGALGGLAMAPGLGALSAAEGGQLWASSGGYGPLRPARDLTTGLVLLQLPEGFRYRTLGWTGEPMSDGRPTPARHDGMAVVRQDGDVITLVRNHEIVNDFGSFGPPEITYDPAAGGGTTTFEFDVRQGRVQRTWTSLAGTLQNCAGGPTPWGTWLSCEEAPVDPGFILVDGGQRRQLRLRKRHGFVFEVPAEGGASAVPLTAMGQFSHEAVAVDPEDGIVYLTEDRHPEAGFYRFLPDRPGELAAGGRLQAMRVAGRDDLRVGVPPLKSFDVAWVDVEEPEMGSTPGTQDMSGIVRQVVRAGGSIFTRLEGCWFHDGQVSFTSTSGGNASHGQVFRFDPVNQTLALIYESPDSATLDYPDNITVSPGGCLMICEDGARLGNMIMGLSPEGELFPFARNAVVLHGEQGFTGDYRDDEWCGACFSPDGKWLFANVQKPGFTVAITGPWEEGRVG